jgi:hypothetical protein
MGFEALAILRDTAAIPLLIECMLEKESAAHVKDEAALSRASVLDIGNFYYKLLVRYEENPASLSALAHDEVESACEFYQAQRGAVRRKEHKPARDQLACTLEDAVTAFVDRSLGAPLARWVLSVPPEIAEESTAFLLSSAIMDETLLKQDTFRLLAVLWAARRLRVHLPNHF